MPVPDIDTLKCVFLDFSSRKRMIGCVTQEVLDQFMSPSGVSGYFDLYYPVEVSVPTVTPTTPTRWPVPSTSTVDPSVTPPVTYTQSAIFYTYLASSGSGKPMEPVTRVSGAAIETMHAYDETSDEQLHTIYDVEARNKVPASMARKI